MQLCARLFLFCFAIFVGMKDPGADHTVFGKNFEIMLYGLVPNGFYFPLRSSSGGRSEETYKECPNLSISSRLDPFLHFLVRSRSS